MNYTCIVWYRGGMTSAFMHLRKRLGNRTYDLALIGVLTLVALLSFALGYRAAQRGEAPAPIIIELAETPSTELE